MHHHILSPTVHYNKFQHGPLLYMILQLDVRTQDRPTDPRVWLYLRQENTSVIKPKMLYFYCSDVETASHAGYGLIIECLVNFKLSCIARIWGGRQEW